MDCRILHAVAPRTTIFDRAVASLLPLVIAITHRGPFLPASDPWQPAARQAVAIMRVTAESLQPVRGASGGNQSQDLDDWAGWNEDGWLEWGLMNGEQPQKEDGGSREYA